MSNFVHWVQIDRAAAAKAERALDDNSDGEVRDEIGFMAIHHAFANRFFPGTSVLHTRLRYLFFVPWLMQKVAAERGNGLIEDRLKRAEAIVKDQLKAQKQDGIIGLRSQPRRMPGQLPSAVYWNALQQWGLVRAYPDGTYPSRGEALQRLVEISDPQRSSLRDEDGGAIYELIGPFVESLPRACKQISAEKGALDFELEPTERKFLADVLSKPGTPACESIFAKLIRFTTDLPDPKSTEFDLGVEWPSWIRDICNNDERKTLRLATEAAALACIGRGVYAALVQTLRRRDGKTSGERDHCALLREAVDRYGAAASRLDIEKLKAAFPQEPLPSAIIHILRKTQNWLQTSKPAKFMDLHKEYAAAEAPRKRAKSRLRPKDRQRRQEWDPDEFSPAEPLHYRLRVVHRLVWDARA